MQHSCQTRHCEPIQFISHILGIIICMFIPSDLQHELGKCAYSLNKVVDEYALLMLTDESKRSIIFLFLLFIWM